MGITVRGSGSRVGGKNRDIDEIGGFRPSKGPLHQRNHRCWNQPKSVVGVLPICGNPILTTPEAEIRDGWR